MIEIKRRHEKKMCFENSHIILSQDIADTKPNGSGYVKN